MGLSGAKAAGRSGGQRQLMDQIQSRDEPATVPQLDGLPPQTDGYLPPGEVRRTPAVPPHPQAIRERQPTDHQQPARGRMGRDARRSRRGALAGATTDNTLGSGGGCLTSICKC